MSHARLCDPESFVEYATETVSIEPEIQWGMDGLASNHEEAIAQRPKIIMDGFAYQGSKILVGGVAKLGKSFFCGNMATALARGGRFLKWNIPNPLKVAYVDFELRPELFNERIARISDWDAPGGLGRLSLREYPQLRNRVELERFLVNKLPEDVDIIVLDCLYKFSSLSEESSNAEMSEIGVWLDNLTKQTGAATLTIHHFGKGDQSKKSVLDRFRGASALVGEMDAIISLTHHEESDHYIVESELRDFPQTSPFVIQKDWPHYVVSDADPEKRPKPGAVKKISDSNIIQAVPVGEDNAAQAKEIAYKVTMTEQKAKIRLDELAKARAIDAIQGRPIRYYREAI